MKVTHLSSDLYGGAKRATERIHEAILLNSEISSLIITPFNANEDKKLTAFQKKIFVGKLYNKLRNRLEQLPLLLQKTTNPFLHSPSWMSVIDSRFINELDADVVHMHWVCSGFISVEEIGKIKKPIIWTMHDMWPFCGSEHLVSDDPHARWRTGYTRNNRHSFDRGIDIDRWVWNRKLKSWKRPIQIVTPSTWLADCAKNSELMRAWDVTVIPNPLDIEKYRPISQEIARDLLSLPNKVKLIAFGAIGGTRLPYKGWDLLQPALLNISKENNNFQCVIFGESKPKYPPDLGMPIHWMGHLHEDVSLALLYSAVDVMVVPSKQESFGQTASEAQACGCPVVAFNTTGLRDIVVHHETGYLAAPFSTQDLAVGIEWVLKDGLGWKVLSTNARQRAVDLWSYSKVGRQYMEVYNKIINDIPQ